MTANPSTRPEFGPFLESLHSSHRRRADIETERADLQRRCEAIAEEEWRRDSCPEPSLLRAILGAVWEILAAIVRRDR